MNFDLDFTYELKFSNIHIVRLITSLGVERQIFLSFRAKLSTRVTELVKICTSYPNLGLFPFLYTFLELFHENSSLFTLTAYKLYNKKSGWWKLGNRELIMYKLALSSRESHLTSMCYVSFNHCILYIFYGVLFSLLG